MIKFKMELDPRSQDVSDFTWVTKKTLEAQNSKKITGLKFHKVSPKLKETIFKDIEESLI